MTVEKLTIGNATLTGFVNKVTDKYALIGTGSYKNRSGDTVYKASVTVFFEDGMAIPAKGAYVEVKGDLNLAESTYKNEDADAGKVFLRATMNVARSYQCRELDPPTKKAPAPEQASDAAMDDMDTDI